MGQQNQLDTERILPKEGREEMQAARRTAAGREENKIFGEGANEEEEKTNEIKRISARGSGQCGWVPG